jgi:hypothetical protein
MGQLPQKFWEYIILFVKYFVKGLDTKGAASTSQTHAAVSLRNLVFWHIESDKHLIIETLRNSSI